MFCTVDTFYTGLIPQYNNIINMYICACVQMDVLYMTLYITIGTTILVYSKVTYSSMHLSS